MEIRYSVYDAETDTPIIIHATSLQCAKRLGLTLGSFYSQASRQRLGKKNGGSTRYVIVCEDRCTEGDTDNGKV